jgi:murein DD-endopeptidase MepM/ murein hydrolase activator NlpD
MRTTWIALALALSAPLPAAAAVAVPVKPGVVVRWPGDGIDSCARGGARWAPIGGACLYPVDLLATGDIEIARSRGGRTERRTLRVGPYPYAVQHVTIEDDSKVNPSARDLERIAREQTRTAKLWSLDTPRRFTLPLQPPLADLPAGGRFGARRVFNGQPRSPHSGADYTAAAGTPVRAAADGRVVLAEDQFFAGRAVFLDHGDGLISMYFHLSSILVAEGAQVKGGQPIGRVGATGRASGPHLHFALRWRGARVDPRFLLAPGDAPIVY